MIDSAAQGKRQGATMSNSTVDPCQHLRFAAPGITKLIGPEGCVGVCPRGGILVA